MRFLALEPRFMFDGAAVSAAAMVSDGADSGVTDADSPSGDAPAAADTAASSDTAQAFLQLGAPALGQDETPRQIAIIDGGIAGLDSILSAIPQGTQVYLVDSSQDGLDQISRILAEHSNLDAIHIISHGNIGSITLGNTTIDSSTLDREGTAIAAWGNALAAHGDILLYGCSVGADGAGLAFINGLATLTQADIAASDDLTGSALLGGDWTLEAETGPIQTAAITAGGFSDLLFTGTIVAGNALVSGLGGADGFGETTLAKDRVAVTALTAGSLDDGFWRVDVSSVFEAGFKVGSTTYNAANQFFVGTNGYVTFGTGERSYSGINLSTYTTSPMIAAFLTDINLTDRTSAGLPWTATLPNAVIVDADTTNDIVTITYNQVGPHTTPATIDATAGNSFQIRLHDYGSGDFGIEFRYASINWAGNSNNNAEAGWTNGDAATFGRVSGSLTTAAKDFDTAALTTTTGHQAVGVWAWDVRGGVVGGGGTTTSPTTSAPIVSNAVAPPPAPIGALPGGLTGATGGISVTGGSIAGPGVGFTGGGIGAPVQAGDISNSPTPVSIAARGFGGLGGGGLETSSAVQGGLGAISAIERTGTPVQVAVSSIPGFTGGSDGASFGSVGSGLAGSGISIFGGGAGFGDVEVDDGDSNDPNLAFNAAGDELGGAEPGALADAGQGPLADGRFGFARQIAAVQAMVEAAELPVRQAFRELGA